MILIDCNHGGHGMELNNKAMQKIQNNLTYSAQRYPLSDLTKRVIGCAINVHKKLGPGFVEKIYQAALAKEFVKEGLKFTREDKITIKYDGKVIGYQIVDFVIEGKVIVELKAVSELSNIHSGQLVSYLKAANLEIGLVLNFAKNRLEIKRIKL